MPHKDIEVRRKYHKEYQKKHKEHLRECSKFYAIKNKEKIAEYHKKYNPKRNARLKELRHMRGISKKYISDCNISKSKEYKSVQRQKRRALKYIGGELSIKTIQMVYEDNIKQYGTLTCYLCLEPVPFKKDHLEHKIPLSRGGTNEYNNLAIACQHCNCKKHNKTVDEFLACLTKERNF